MGVSMAVEARSRRAGLATCTALPARVPRPESRVPSPGFLSHVPASSPDSELRTQVERAIGTHYDLDCEIGRGGMGVVYRGRDRRLKRTVAIKVLPPELAFRREIRSRFVREAQTAAQLNHAHIVDIFSVDESELFVYFVMAYIRGDNLAKQVHDRGPLDPEEARCILRDVADALAYAHAQGVIHRDIKPDNIVIEADTRRAMVTDFGLARAITDAEARLTASGIAMGTPTYMSPEQAAGEREVDGRADLYSLGAVAYYMLTGSPPFTAKSGPALLVKHLSEAPTPIQLRRPELSVELSRIVMTLLEKSPDARFENAASLVTALDGAVASGPTRAPQRDWGPPKTVPASTTAVSPTVSPVLPPGSPAKWSAPPVRSFRSHLAIFLIIDPAVVILALITSRWVLGLALGHALLLGFEYVALLDKGFDWHDVFRQPADRDLMDVLGETLRSMGAVLLPGGRASRSRSRRRSASLDADGEPTSGQALYDNWVRRGRDDRDEILAMLAEMDAGQRAAFPDVDRSAKALAAKMEALAASLAELDRVPIPQAGEQRKAMAGTLESCGSLIESMKLGLRLATGRQAQNHVRSLASEALSLAESVDSTLLVTDEISRRTGAPRTSGPTR
jgi:serine/threonine protein kinase